MPRGDKLVSYISVLHFICYNYSQDPFTFQQCHRHPILRMSPCQPPTVPGTITVYPLYTWTQANTFFNVSLCNLGQYLVCRGLKQLTNSVQPPRLLMFLSIKQNTKNNSSSGLYHNNIQYLLIVCFTDEPFHKIRSSSSSPYKFLLGLNLPSHLNLWESSLLIALTKKIISCHGSLGIENDVWKCTKYKFLCC